MHKMQHITEKEVDLLSYFYEHREGHVRKIKKATKQSEHTLLKYLHTLEIKKMLSSQKEGNLKIYEVNLQNTLVKIFFSYFDLEKLEALEYRRGKAIKQMINEIIKIKIPYFILLFGSTAKGNYTIKSDVDIIIVYDLIKKSIIKQINQVEKNILAETNIKINCIPMQLEEFLKEKENKQNYALQDAINYGYPVFANQLYYEVIFK